MRSATTSCCAFQRVISSSAGIFEWQGRRRLLQVDFDSARLADHFPRRVAANHPAKMRTPVVEEFTFAATNIQPGQWPVAESVPLEEIGYQDPPTGMIEFASFDFITAVCVYHHVEEPNRIPLTRDVHGLLRPNGIFCMIEHNPFNPVTRLIVKQCPIDVDAHLLTASSARRYAHAAGLHPTETQYFLYLPEKYYRRMPRIERSFRNFPLGGQYAVFAEKRFDGRGVL